MATKLNSGKWRAQVFLGEDENGKRLYKSFIADTEDEADYAALAFKLGKGKRVERKNITLRAAMRAYIESKRPLLSPSTIRGYETIERNFGPFLDTPILNITKISLQKAITEYMFGKRNDGKKGQLSPKTVRNAYGLICAALKQNDIILGEITLPRKSEVEYATPFEDDLAKIFEAVRGTNIEIPVLLSAFCSLRRGEICGLRFSDVDFENKCIRVSRSLLHYNKSDFIKEPKTAKSKRTVYVTDYILNMIAALPRESDDDFIFPLTPDVLTKSLPRILKEKGLPVCRFHDLRHSFASILHAHGIDMTYILSVGGWASDRVAKNVYIQRSEQLIKGKSEEANSIFEDILKKA